MTLPEALCGYTVHLIALHHLAFDACRTGSLAMDIGQAHRFFRRTYLLNFNLQQRNLQQDMA